MKLKNKSNKIISIKKVKRPKPNFKKSWSIASKIK